MDLHRPYVGYCIVVGSRITPGGDGKRPVPNVQRMRKDRECSQYAYAANNGIKQTLDRA